MEVARIYGLNHAKDVLVWAALLGGFELGNTRKSVPVYVRETRDGDNVIKRCLTLEPGPGRDVWTIIDIETKEETGSPKKEEVTNE